MLFCLQGHNPVNFPDHPYDIQEICRPANLDEFIQQSREMAARLTKSRQSSRLALASRNLSTYQHIVPATILIISTLLQQTLCINNCYWFTHNCYASYSCLPAPASICTYTAEPDKHIVRHLVFLDPCQHIRCIGIFPSALVQLNSPLQDMILHVNCCVPRQVLHVFTS